MAEITTEILKDEVETGEDEVSAYQKLFEWADEDNLAEMMEEEDLRRIGREVVEGYNDDLRSRDDWQKIYDSAMKLAKLTEEKKNTPWPGAANIKYPMITQGAIQFSARAMASILADGNIIKGRVVGNDPNGQKAARAQRIANHMTFQLTERIDNWIDDLDKLLIALPLVGCGFRKTWQKIEAGRPASEYVSAEDLVVNYYAPSLEEAQRVTHVYEVFPNTVVENVRNGIYRDIITNEGDQEAKQAGGYNRNNPYIILEQHRWLDLDDDGYEEPYIVTVHKATEDVLRIRARYDKEDIYENEKGQIAKIKAIQYFTRFLFMPAIDGGFYGMGMGMLLNPLNKAINTTINQLLDAGTRANTGGGFIDSSVSVMGGTKQGSVYLSPGEYKKATGAGGDMRKAVYSLQFNGPSETMFHLLGLLVEVGERLQSTTDVLTGEHSSANQPASTTLALIEQGLTHYTAVIKRLYIALSNEFKKLRRLNKLYLEEQEYYLVLDDRYAIARMDYDDKDCDVVPTADPKNVTDIQKVLKAESVMKLLGQGLNDREIYRTYLEALRIENIDKILPLEDAGKEPDPEQIMEAEKLKLEERKVLAEEKKIAIEAYKVQSEIKKIEAEAIKALADAKAQDNAPQIEALTEQVEDLGNRGEELAQIIKTQEGLIAQAQEDIQPQIKETLGAKPPEQKAKPPTKGSSLWKKLQQKIMLAGEKA